MSWAATRMEVADLIEGYASCYAARMPVRLREPTDFAFYLLPLLCNGGSAGFRGTTAAGATIIMDAQRSGRPLEAAVHGQQRIWLVVLSTSQDRSLREGADYGSSQVSIDELRLLPLLRTSGSRRSIHRPIECP